MSIQYVQLAHAAFLCKDVDIMYKFYTEVLGLEYAFTLNYDDGKPWLTYLKTPSGQFIELFYKGYECENKTKERSFHHFCLEVDDMPAVLQKLKDRGIEVFSGPPDLGRRMPIPNPDHQPGKCGSYCAFIRDPEGNDIEIQQFTPDSLQLKA